MFITVWHHKCKTELGMRVALAIESVSGTDISPCVLGIDSVTQTDKEMPTWSPSLLDWWLVQTLKNVLYIQFVNPSLKLTWITVLLLSSPIFLWDYYTSAKLRACTHTCACTHDVGYIILKYFYSNLSLSSAPLSSVDPA